MVNCALTAVPRTLPVSPETPEGISTEILMALIEFIKSQQLYSWCIPMYYGETKDYFILTSPCFINGGAFTDEANDCISDLHEALISIITINVYK